MSLKMSHQPPLRSSFLLIESPSNSVESFPGRAFWRLKTRRRWQARKRKPVGKGDLAYGKLPIYSEFSHKKMVIFYSCVELPDGTLW
jgi:hypothetical protein